MLCLNAFKEADVFADLSRLFYNERPIYDKDLNLFCDKEALVFNMSNV